MRISVEENKFSSPFLPVDTDVINVNSRTVGVSKWNARRFVWISYVRVYYGNSTGVHFSG